MAGNAVVIQQASRRYHTEYLWYLLATILVLPKHSKFERMSGCNYSLIIEKGQFIKWMVATGIANQLDTFEKRDNYQCLFQKNTIPSRNTRSLQVAFRSNDSTTQMYGLRNTVSIEGWLAASTFVKKRNSALWKKLLLEIKYSNLEGKNVFLGITTVLWITVFSCELLFH